MIIEDNVFNELEINKSKFITYIYKVKNIEAFTKYLFNLKNQYKDATHICYAYIIDNKIKFYDDGEPAGSAGRPILEVLKKNNLNFVACFVVRYFGGIKLGSGGLIRAYSNSTSLALKKTSLKKLEKLIKMEVIVSFQESKALEKLLNNQNILKKTYQEKITYLILGDKTLEEKLSKLNYNFKIIDENYF